MKQKILVVEDDPSISDLISLHLKKNDYDYLVVQSGEDALSQLEFYLPDFIILDWMIPNLSGLEVLKRIRNQSTFKNIPILKRHKIIYKELDNLMDLIHAVSIHPFDEDEYKKNQLTIDTTDCVNK